MLQTFIISSIAWFVYENRQDSEPTQIKQNKSGKQ